MLTASAAITDFSIFTAHVSAIDRNYTNMSDLWLNANGELLPMIVSLVYTLLYKKASKSSLYRIFSCMFTLTSTGAIFAWTINPFIYLKGNAPISDDITKFSYKFPRDVLLLIVSTVALSAAGVSTVMIIRKKLFKILLQKPKRNKKQKNPG